MKKMQEGRAMSTWTTWIVWLWSHVLCCAFHIFTWFSGSLIIETLKEWKTFFWMPFGNWPYSFVTVLIGFSSWGIWPSDNRKYLLVIYVFEPLKFSQVVDSHVILVDIFVFRDLHISAPLINVIYHVILFLLCIL